MISQEFIDRYFPNDTLIEVPPVYIAGIRGKGPITTKKASLQINIKAIDSSQPFSTQEDVYVVDTLSCGILLGLTFLKRNKLHIIWGDARRSDTLLHDKTNLRVAVTSLTHPSAMRETAVIRAGETVTILPRQGYNVTIQHRLLPVAADGYIVEGIQPRTLQNPGIGVLIRALMDSQDRRLAYANFGDHPVTIRKDEVIGYLKKATIVHTIDAARQQPHAIMPLADLLGQSVDPEQEDPKYPDRYPFHLPQLDDDAERFDPSSVDISNH